MNLHKFTLTRRPCAGRRPGDFLDGAHRVRGHDEGMKVRAGILSTLLAGLCLNLAPYASAQDANTRIVHQGHLEKISTGAPITEQHEIRLNLYANATGGTPLNPNPYIFSHVDFHHGEYTLTFDLPSGVDASAPLWLDMSLRPSGSTAAFVTLSPRSRFSTAAHAQHAFSVQSATQLAPNSVGMAHIIPAQVQRRVSSECSGGVLASIGVTGTVGCVTPPITPTIVREVVTSSAIGGGGNSGTVYLEVATAGITENLLIASSIGSSDIAANAVTTSVLADNSVGSAAINSSQVQARVGGTCPAGKGITGIAADGNPTCGVTTVAALAGNSAINSSATVLIGTYNAATGTFSIAGGRQSRALGSMSAAFGYAWPSDNATTASGAASLAIGGRNTASGSHSVAAGDATQHVDANCAGGHYSVALGTAARVRPGSESGVAGKGCEGVPVSGAWGDNGTFVWNSGGGTFTSVGDNRFLLHASGGFYFGGSGAPSVTIPNNRLINTSTGARLTIGGNWTNASSRVLKHAFARVDTNALLDRVLALPLGRWKYLNAEGEGWHLGPAAEDFSDAFGLGASAQHITSVDANGVALVAIQGLAQRIEQEQQETLEALERENARLHEALARLSARVTRMGLKEVQP